MQERTTTVYFTNEDDARDAMQELETSGYSSARMRLERADGEHGSTFMDKVKEFFGTAPSSSAVSGVFLVLDEISGDAVNIVRRYGGEFSERPTSINHNTSDGDEQRLLLREERLRVEKEAEQQGEFRVRKEVFTENQRVDVPVSHDEVYVERRDASESGDENDRATIDEEGEIRIPVTREEVHVEKRPVTTEEIVVGKRRVTETQTVGADVRKERARIESDTDIDSSNVHDSRSEDR